jgi:hypothetical protein
MWEAQYVTATFEPANFNLVVTNGGGGKGLVTSIQAAVSCPTGKTCTVAVANGATVTLRATAGADSVFRGWSDACTGTGDCTVTMTGNRSVGATIEPATYLMQVIPQGSGVGTVTSAPVGIVCGKGAGDCLENWPNGTVVILRAEAPPGFKILRWTDAGVTVCAGAPECRFTMTRSRFIGAVFGVAH